MIHNMPTGLGWFVLATMTITLTIAGLGGCSSFSTIPTKGLSRVSGVNPSSINGLFYELPIGLIHISGGEASTAKTTPSPSPSGEQSNQSTPIISASQPGYTLSISVVLQADSDSSYFLKPDRNYFYDDSVALSVGSNHLLTSSNAVSTDQTANILASIASLAATFAPVPHGAQPHIGVLIDHTNDSFPKTITIQDFIDSLKTVPNDYQLPIATFLNLDQQFISELKPKDSDTHKAFIISCFSRSTFTIEDLRFYLSLFRSTDVVSNQLVDAFNPFVKKASKQKTQVPFDFMFDPTSTTVTKDFLDQIHLYSGIRVTCTEDNESSFAFNVSHSVSFSENTDILQGKQISGSQSYVNGIAFRPGRVWTITMVSDDKKINLTQTFILPDKNQTLLLDYDRIPFISKSTNVTFSNGMLVGFNQTVPSPVLGFLAIPKSIIQAILPLPQSSTPKSSGNGAAK